MNPGSIPLDFKLDTLEGMHVDTDRLADLQEALNHRERGEFAELMAQVPAAVKRMHLNNPKMANKHPDDVLKFSRPDFVRDVLFSRQGFNLTPIVWTKSTMNLPDNEKVASTSAKDHLPYFDDHPFVNAFMDYQRLSKMRNTYVGKAAIPEHEIENENGELELVPATDPTGFWKYVYNGKIHPSFLLHRTVTGRSASAKRPVTKP